MDNAPGDLSTLTNYVRLTDSAPTIVMDFRGFSDPLFYSTEERNLRAIGAIPMVTLDPAINGVGIPLAAIAAGDYDGYLDDQARAAKAWGRPIYVRFGQEMNLPRSPWGKDYNGNTPALFIAAWRHVVSLFRREKAMNVRWVWSPNADCSGNCPFDAYYPGSAWVDDVALDGYNFAGAHGVPWVSFATLFGRSYAELTALSDKPVMISETTASEVGGNKASWITHAFLHVIPTRFPRVVAVIWWDRQDSTADWRINSSAATLEAWRKVAASPLYAPTSQRLDAAARRGAS